MVRVHHLSKAMVLGPADSGTTFVSAAGGRAWLSGGRVIRAADAAWQPIPGSKALKAALFFSSFFLFFFFFFFFAPGRVVSYTRSCERDGPSRNSQIMFKCSATLPCTTPVQTYLVTPHPPKKNQKNI